MKHVRHASRPRSATQITAVVLIVYWVTLFLGTHWPGGMKVGTGLSDKHLHFLAYAGLGFLVALLLPRLGLWRRIAGVSQRRVYGGGFLIGSGYGVLDELGQIPIPGRTAELGDWVADVLGVAAGLMLYWLATRRLGRGTCTPPVEQKKPSPP